MAADGRWQVATVARRLGNGRDSRGQSQLEVATDGLKLAVGMAAGRPATVGLDGSLRPDLA